MGFNKLKEVDDVVRGSIGNHHILTSGSLRRAVVNSVPYDSGGIKYQIPYGCKNAMYICRLHPVGHIYSVSDIVDPLAPHGIEQYNFTVQSLIKGNSTIVCSTLETFQFSNLSLPVITLLPVYSSVGLAINKVFVTDFFESPKIYFTLINHNSHSVRLYPNQGIVTLMLFKSKIDITLENHRSR